MYSARTTYCDTVEMSVLMQKQKRFIGLLAFKIRKSFTGFLIVFFHAHAVLSAQEVPQTQEAVKGVGQTGVTASLDWPRFLGPNYDGSVQEGDAQIDWGKEPDFLWQLEVGDGYGISSVAGDRVYQCDSVGGSRFSAGDERLRCIDLNSGKVLWEKLESIEYQDLYGYEAGPRSSPLIHKDRVITYGVTGKLVCRRAKDGQKLWSVDTSLAYGVVQNFFGVGAAPLVFEDLVIVMVGGSPPEDQAIPPGQLDRVISSGSALVAFDLKSGKERWKSGDDLASYSSPRPIKLGTRNGILLFARNGLIAVDARSGEELWRFDHRASILESVNGMMPVVKDDRVFISECYQIGSALLKVDDSAAQVVWQDDRRSREKSMRSHWSTPVLVGDYLYGCSGRNAPDSDFRCVRFSTGKVQWVDPRRTRTSVTRWGDHLLVIEERGMFEVMKVNHREMEVIASHDLSLSRGARPALRFPCWSAPVVVGNYMLVRGDQRVLCLAWKTK